MKLSYNSNNPDNQAYAEYVIQMYKKILGVTITPDPVEGATLVNMRKDVKTYPQMNYREGWCADYPDPQDWLSTYWHSQSGFAQRFGFSNPEADKLMDQADVELDPQKRVDLYLQAQRLIIGDAPAIIRDNTKNQFLIKPYVKGLDFTPQDSDYPGGQTAMLDVTIDK